MWTYRQSTGQLFHQQDPSPCDVQMGTAGVNADDIQAYPTAALVGLGYSGHGVGKNNPALQGDRMTGPIPRGFYMIEAPQDTAEHGPYAMQLVPFPENEMFGRSGFLMHGDSVEHPGQASMGCVIMARLIRETVWDSGDHTLEVIE